MLTFINNPKSAANHGLLRVKVQVQILARTNIVVTLLQKSALFTAPAIRLQIEAGVRTRRIKRKQLKRNNRQHNTLIIISDEFTPAVFVGTKRLGKIGGTQSAPRAEIFRVCAYTVYTRFRHTLVQHC